MKNQELFDKYANGAHWNNHPTTYANSYANFLLGKTAGPVVDLGSGSGRDVNVFIEKGFSAIGIDNDLREIYRAKENYPDAYFEYADIHELPFEDGVIPAFYAVNVIHYVDAKKAFSEFHRCLRHDGYLFIHFNMSIKDYEGVVDYQHSPLAIQELTKDFSLVQPRHFERVDEKPFRHTHSILELILMK